jgi:hypothetical protein
MTASMSPAFVASRHMTWTCSGGVGFTKSAVVSWDHMGAWFAQLVTCAASSSCSRRTGSGEAAATLYGAAVPDAGNSSPLYGADLAKMRRVRTVISRELGHHRVERLMTISQRLSPNEVAALALRSLDGLCLGP